MRIYLKNLYRQQFSLGKLIATAVSFLALGAIFFTACESGVGAGDGLSANSRRVVGAPIPITSAADLEKIGTDDDDYPINGDYVLAADLSLSNWTPIPLPAPTTPYTAFTGTFDGAGHTITLSKFSSTATGGTNAYLGIFRQISGGEVRNLKVNLGVGLVTPTSYPSSAYFGGVTGYAANTTFSDITVTGTADVSWDVNYTDYNTGLLFVGGISGDNVNVVIGNARNEANVNASTAVQGSSCYVGGLIGRGDLVTIDRSTGVGTIKGSGPGYNSSAGGIAGYITQSTITYSGTDECHITLYAASGNFELNLWQAYAGGLVGYSANGSKIEKCSTIYGSVSVFAPYPYAGGLVGYNYGVFNYPNPPNNGSKILRSESNNEVEAISQGASGGLPYAGGLVGYSAAEGSRVENSFARGNVGSTGSPTAVRQFDSLTGSPTAVGQFVSSTGSPTKVRQFGGLTDRGICT